ncbi:MAG: HAD family phosphatase [Nitrospirota bacterium]
MIKAVVFDFGGVLAEEGFREGLKAIGKKYGLDPDSFYTIGRELVYQTGYVTGRATEADYWSAIRQRTGIDGEDEELRNEILNRFIVREEMIELVKRLKSSGFVTAILSDQTNWLEEINQVSSFSGNFDYIFNSFRLKKSKRDSLIFRDMCSAMGFEPDDVIFIDDSSENIERASAAGLVAIHFRNMQNLKRELLDLINLEKSSADVERAKNVSREP